MRSVQVGGQRRKVLAIAAKIPDGSWYVPFLNDFLGFDVLSLDGDVLNLSSDDPVATELFGPTV
jgi:hypothetical protein